MGKLLLIAKEDLVFIIVVGAVALLLAALLVIYFKVKRRVNDRFYRCNPEDEGHTEDEIKEGYAEDGFVASQEQDAETESELVQTQTSNVEEEGYNAVSPENTAPKEMPQIMVGKNGETIEIALEEDVYRFYIKGAGGDVLGVSEPYKSKAGAIKGLKSLAGYSDAVIFTGGDAAQCPMFEIAEDVECFGYRLLTKSHIVKLSGSGFEDKESCIKACETIKELSNVFDL